MIKIRQKFIIAHLIAWGCTHLYAQRVPQNFLGSWNGFNIIKNINSKSNLWTDAQLRSLKFYNWFHYYQFEVAYFYLLNNSFSAALGTGKYVTYGYGDNFAEPVNQNEWRFWEQIVNRQSVGNLKLENRYRAEQRFTNNGFKNRFRLRIGANLPLYTKDNLPKTSLWASGELFFTNTAPYFQRLRSNAAFVSEITPKLSLQTGYVYQFDYKINDETGVDFLQIMIIIKL